MKQTITTIALLCATTAHAEFISGNELLSNMTGDSNAKLFAFGYVAGVYDTTTTVVHCAPASVTLRQVNDTVRKGLEAVPELRNKSADSLINLILKTVWPCAAEKPAQRGGVL